MTLPPGWPQLMPESANRPLLTLYLLATMNTLNLDALDGAPELVTTTKALGIPLPVTYPLDTGTASLEPWVSAIEDAGGMPDDYDTWLRTALAFADVGESGRELFHRVSCLSQKYNAAETDMKFDEALKSRNGTVTAGTFVHLCKEAGIIPPRSESRSKRNQNEARGQRVQKTLQRAGYDLAPQQVIEAIQAVLRAKKGRRTDGGLSVLTRPDGGLGISPAAAEIIRDTVLSDSSLTLSGDRRPCVTRADIRDQLALKWTVYFDPGSGTYYYALPGDDNPASLKKFDERSPFLNQVLFELEQEGLRTDKRTLIETIQNPYCYQEFNYLTTCLDYLACLWDGKDYLSQLTATVASDNDALFAILLKKWLLNCVAQAYCNSPGCRNEHALVLVSPKQGVGKTSFFAGLLWDDAFFASVPEFRFDNKEHRLLMTSKLLILLDEMGQYKKADIETLKAGISQYQITADKKFQSMGDYARIGSFAGCSNNDTFLKDDTGDRRFWVFMLKSFNRELYESVPKDQLWGQLVSLYKAGAPYLPTVAEEAEVTARNDDKFAADKPEDAFIAECLVITNDPEDFIKSIDMQGAVDLFRYNRKGQGFLSVETIRRKLQRLNVETSTKRRVGTWQGRGYAGVRLKS
jgi:hypothetical protein